MLCSLVMTSPLEQATHRPSTAAGNLLNFSVSCGERYVALPTCELTFASSTYSPFKFTGPCVALVRIKVVRI